jgi:two-component system, OmpR family, response regulator
MPRCLLVDDDAEIRTLVADYLHRFGFSVLAAGDAAAMRMALVREPFDVVLLDLMLPDANGLDLCRWLRHTHPALPVLMLTAQGDPISRVLGLELGADDYIAKPFEPRELVARINAVLRRAAAPRVAPSVGKPQRFAARHFAGWALDETLRELRAPDGVLVPLSNAEFRLLKAFTDHPGQVLGRERLLDLTRAPGAEPTDRSVDLAVSRLRQKLGAAARGGELIRTLRGSGYQFTGEVS